MQRLFQKSPFIFVAVLGFVFLIPFIVLEFINVVWKFGLSFPFILFIFLWLHQSLFIFILIPIIKREKSSQIVLLMRIIVLAILAYAWVNVIFDQWPCFIGVPNCD